MSILSEQLTIGEKVVSNDIALDPVARSLTMCNGYYVDHKYPDNRTVMTGENPWTGTTTQTISSRAWERREFFYDGGYSEWKWIAYTKTTDVTTTNQIATSKTAGQIG